MTCLRLFEPEAIDICRSVDATMRYLSMMVDRGALTSSYVVVVVVVLKILDEKVDDSDPREPLFVSRRVSGPRCRATRNGFVRKFHGRSSGISPDLHNNGIHSCSTARRWSMNQDHGGSDGTSSSYLAPVGSVAVAVRVAPRTRLVGPNGDGSYGAWLRIGDSPVGGDVYVQLLGRTFRHGQYREGDVNGALSRILGNEGVAPVSTDFDSLCIHHCNTLDNSALFAADRKLRGESRRAIAS